MNRFSCFFLLPLLFATLVHASTEELLLTSNVWVRDGSDEARVACSLRGQSISDGSIRCATELMLPDNGRYSFRTERQQLSPEGKFDFFFEGPTAVGKDFFRLSGQVMRAEGEITIQFDVFHHRVLIFDLLPVFNVTFKDFVSTTAPFSPEIADATQYDNVKACSDHVKFEKARVPDFCEFHGFNKSELKFPVECKLLNGAYKVEMSGRCLD